MQDQQCWIVFEDGESRVTTQIRERVKIFRVFAAVYIYRPLESFHLTFCLGDYKEGKVRKISVEAQNNNSTEVLVFFIPFPF